MHTKTGFTRVLEILENKKKIHFPGPGNVLEFYEIGNVLENILPVKKST